MHVSDLHMQGLKERHKFDLEMIKRSYFLYLAIKILLMYSVSNVDRGSSVSHLSCFIQLVVKLDV